MKTEIYTDPTAFLAAVNGKRKAKPRSARAAAGEGNRQAHLDKLAARGYTIVFSTPGGPCYLRNPRTGRETPQLQALADDHNISMAWLGRQAILEFMAKYRHEAVQLPLNLSSRVKS